MKVSPSPSSAFLAQPTLAHAASSVAMAQGTSGLGRDIFVPAAQGSALNATRARAKVEAERELGANTHEVTIDGLEGTRQVLEAGRNHFAALWTRDACFAALGALNGTDLRSVHDSLDSLLAKQREDGLVPRRLGPGDNTWQVIRAALGIKTARATRFSTADFKSGQGGPPIDSNSLVVWLSAEYVAKSGDTEFLRKNLPQLDAAMGYLRAQVNDGLLTQVPFTDWRDLTGRSGKILYSNVLYSKALSSLADLHQRLGEPEKGSTYRAEAAQLNQNIQKTFWDEERGYFHDSPEVDIFSVDGNFLAVYLGIATHAQAIRVLDKADLELKLPSGLYRSVDRPFADNLSPWYLNLLGMKGYGDGTMIWPWNTSLYALAAVAAGEPDRAEAALQAIAESVDRDGDFEEIYEGDGSKPAKRLFYRSEQDFSWSAGLYLRATAELEKLRSNP